MLAISSPVLIPSLAYSMLKMKKSTFCTWLNGKFCGVYTDVKWIWIFSEGFFQPGTWSNMGIIVLVTHFSRVFNITVSKGDHQKQHAVYPVKNLYAGCGLCCVRHHITPVLVRANCACERSFNTCFNHLRS